MTGRAMALTRGELEPDADAPHGIGAHPEIGFDTEVGQVGVVELGFGILQQRLDPATDLLTDPLGRGAAAIAMDQALGSAPLDRKSVV